ESEKRPQARPPDPLPPEDDAASISYALRLWRETGEFRATLGETYFRRDRQIECTEDLSHCLRWHSRLNALIALFRAIKTDEPRAVSRIFLDADGHKIERKFAGRVGGCAVKIDPDENVTMGLHICEGIETALAARELGLSPVWALGSVVEIAKFPV